MPTYLRTTKENVSIKNHLTIRKKKKKKEKNTRGKCYSLVICIGKQSVFQHIQEAGGAKHSLAMDSEMGAQRGKDISPASHSKSLD